MAFSIFSSGCGAKLFQQFWWRTSQGSILSSLVEIGRGVMEEMLSEVFCICSSGHHFVHRSGTACAIFVENFSRNNPIKFSYVTMWLRKYH